MAVAIAKAASTTPAIANEPVSPRTSRMIARDVPAIGIRSIAVPITGCLASRMARIRLYRSPLTRPPPPAGRGGRVPPFPPPPPPPQGAQWGPPLAGPASRGRHLGAGARGLGPRGRPSLLRRDPRLRGDQIRRRTRRPPLVPH